MTKEEQKKVIADFIKSHTLGVVATVDASGQPEAAAVEYGEVDDFSLVLDVFDQSRKFKNMQQNARVAFVIGWDEDITVQYEGTAQLLSGEELIRCKAAYFAKNPRAKKWDGREGIVYVKLSPRWIRYSNLHSDPWEVFEVAFNE